MGFTMPFEVMTFPGTGTASMPGNSRISVIIPVRDDRVVVLGRLCSGLKVYTRVRSGETEVTEVYPAIGHTEHPKTVCRKAGPDVAGSKAHSASVSWISKRHQTSAILGNRKIIPSRSIVDPTCGGR
jgi:hypothetical protein